MATPKIPAALPVEEAEDMSWVVELEKGTLKILSYNEAKKRSNAFMKALRQRHASKTNIRLTS
jgi:hypothetical protein